MRVLFSSIVLALFALAGPARAQQATRLPDGTDNAVGLDGGLESAFIARASYTRRLELGLLRDERLFARFTLPVVMPDLGDWSLDAGAQATVLSYRDFRLALLAGPVVRHTENVLFSATAIGVGGTMLLGYEGARWGLSAELGYEQILATHLSQTPLYRNVGYAGAKDGWYATTGSTTQVGLRGGVRVGAVEISARGGLAATGHFHPTYAPFYFTLGVSYAF